MTVTPIAVLPMLVRVGRWLYEKDRDLLRARVRNSELDLKNSKQPRLNISLMRRETMVQARQALDGLYTLDGDTMALLRTLEETCAQHMLTEQDGDMLRAMGHLRSARIHLDRHFDQRQGPPHHDHGADHHQHGPGGGQHGPPRPAAGDTLAALFPRDGASAGAAEAGAAGD